MKKVIIIRYGEIFLKGANRSFFENALVTNIKKALVGEKFTFTKYSGRYIISEFDESRTEILLDKVSCVFGVHSFSLAYETDTDIDNIAEAAKLISGEKGTLKVNTKSADKKFLETVLEKNKSFLLWCKDNRRKSERELYSWHTNPELNNRCDESGMDNSPRFDTESDLYAIDFSCYMANEARFMKKIADELSDKESSAEVLPYSSARHFSIHTFNSLIKSSKPSSLSIDIIAI